MEETVPSVVQKTIDDIREIKIQGATNVALSTFESIKEWAQTTEINDIHQFKDKLGTYLYMLANARPNEPLAKNGAKFVSTMLSVRHPKLTEVEKAKEITQELAAEYIEIIENSKKRIIEIGKEVVKDAKVLFTHCHSSTAESIIIELNSMHPVTAINTETRPLYQGRITSKNLIKAGVKAIMIVDSAAPYFITDDSTYPLDAVFLGADQISFTGDAVNKVGSFSMGLASYYGSKPLYIVTPSLKFDPATVYQPIKIELREAKEIWEDAPPELDIINPAFDLVPHEMITGYITELGLIKPEELEDKVRRRYEWVT